MTTIDTNPSHAPLTGALDAYVATGEGRRTSPRQILAHLLISLPQPMWMALDAIILWVAIVKGYEWFDPSTMPLHAAPLTVYSTFAAAVLICSLIFGLNERTTLLSRGHILTRMFLTTALSTTMVYAVVYVMLYTALSRRIVAVTVIGYLLTGTSLRLLASYAVHRVRRRVVVVGSSVACAAFVRRLRESAIQTHAVIGCVHGPTDRTGGSTGLPLLGTTQDIVRITRDQEVHNIVVCNGSARDPEVMNWMLPCLRLGCRVTNEAIFYEDAVGEIMVDEITPDWFLFSDLKAHCEEYATVKRLFDIAVAFVGLLISAPFYPLIALAIKLEDGGPVFYSQLRVGRGGATFPLYKFRTMHPSAKIGESRWASPNDPRITRVGRLLRRTRLDEFPQFYNIMIGQMSVVGPRPEQPDIVVDLCKCIPFWSERNLVKPGLTGWAQIMFKYGNTVADARRKLQFDFYYLKHMNLELDIIILFRTLGTFLRGAC